MLRRLRFYRADKRRASKGRQDAHARQYLGQRVRWIFQPRNYGPSGAVPALLNGWRRSGDQRPAARTAKTGYLRSGIDAVGASVGPE
jgi:hypothetical protein